MPAPLATAGAAISAGWAERKRAGAAGRGCTGQLAEWCAAVRGGARPALALARRGVREREPALDGARRCAMAARPLLRLGGGQRLDNRTNFVE